MSNPTATPFKSTTHHCTICGGRGGAFNANGAHFLCAARAAHGRLTPRIGDRCIECDGEGWVWPAGLALIDPSQRAIDAIKSNPANQCRACGGSGHERNGDDDDE